VEIMDAMNASNTKKCPICPGSRCSPSNSISVIIYYKKNPVDW
jgi:hypothetical protein